MGGLSIWQGCFLGEVSPGNTLLVPGCSLHDPVPDKQKKVNGWIDGQINKKHFLLSSDKWIFLFVLWFFGFYVSFLGLDSIFGFGRFWLLFFLNLYCPASESYVSQINATHLSSCKTSMVLTVIWGLTGDLSFLLFYSITLFIHYYNHWFTRLCLLLSAYVFMNKKNTYGYM